MNKYGLTPARAGNALTHQKAVSKSQSQETPFKRKELRKGILSSKRINTFEDSMQEQKLDMALKISLAKNITNPDYPIMKETAFLIEDLLRAVEKGRASLSPRAKHRIYKQAPLMSTNGLPVNKALAIRMENQKMQREEDLEKQKKLRSRQEKLKQKLEVYSLEKQKKRVEEQKQKKENDERKVLEEKEKEMRKKKFYQNIRLQYEKERLPEILERENNEDKVSRELRRERQRKKEEAEQKVQQSIANLMRQFNQKR